MKTIPQLVLLLLVMVAAASLTSFQITPIEDSARAASPPPDSTGGIPATSLLIAERSAANPLITVPVGPFVTDPDALKRARGLESKSQYIPAPIRLSNGDLWLYVKGDDLRAIWAYRSTDEGESFAVQNGATPVLSRGRLGAWDDVAAIDPAAFYDAETDTIHLYYKARTGSTDYGPWAWGHATAPGATPTAFTKDPANPILTAASVQTSLGLSNVDDNYVSDVIRIGGTFFFYGGYRDGPGTDYKIFYATGTTPNNPVAQATILSPQRPYDIVQAPSVFRVSDSSGYTMIFSEGCESACPPESRLVVAFSVDGKTWLRVGRELLRPSAGWESAKVFAASILKGNTRSFDLAESVNGKFLVYYSGYDGSHRGTTQTGLLRLVPTTFPMFFPSLADGGERIVADHGTYLVRTRVTSGAAAGDVVLGNNRTIRSVDAAGLSTYLLLSGSTSDTVQVGADKVVTIGAAGFFSDAAGDELVLKANKSIRSVNAAGSASIPLLRLDGNDNLVLDGSGGHRTRLGSATSRLHLPIVATASLPAAGAVEDGSILIEETESTDRNLIIYAGGQRFRIQGGTPF